VGPPKRLKTTLGEFGQVREYGCPLPSLGKAGVVRTGVVLSGGVPFISVEVCSPGEGTFMSPPTKSSLVLGLSSIRALMDSIVPANRPSLLLLIPKLRECS
jgi:hypothetical protein